MLGVGRGMPTFKVAPAVEDRKWGDWRQSHDEGTHLPELLGCSALARINRGNGELDGQAAGGDRGALRRLGSGWEGESSKG